MWARYGDADRGVRISLKEVRFPWSLLHVNISRETRLHKKDGSPQMVGLQIRDVRAPYEKKTMFGTGYVLLPTGADEEAVFGSDVLYATNPEAEVQRRVTLTEEGMTFRGDATYAARVKGTAWADQAEHRFVISAIKGPLMDHAAEPTRYSNALLDLIEAGSASGFANFSPDVPYIDLPLANDAFEGVIVTTGSWMPSALRDALERSIKDMVPTAIFEECALKVRPRH